MHRNSKWTLIYSLSISFSSAPMQVHTRITYLRHLIVSLAQAKDISKILLIFSHDYYDEDINDLVQTIDFCKVLQVNLNISLLWRWLVNQLILNIVFQIFYPYSIQTHEHEFPGEDPGDCPRDIKRDQWVLLRNAVNPSWLYTNLNLLNRAILRKCNNALHPDVYGHYREAKFTQTKHHWWWKANRVFDQLDVTRHHTGLYIALGQIEFREIEHSLLYICRFGAVSRGRPLCGRGFLALAGIDAETGHWTMRQVQHSVVGHIFENVQLLHLHEHQ